MGRMARARRRAGRRPHGGLTAHALRDGVTAEAAADLLWVLTSFESFDLLLTGRGLSADEAADVLVETAERALICPAAGTAARVTVR